MLAEPLGDFGVAIAAGVTTIIVLVFAEVLPKTYALADPDKTARLVARPARFFVWILSPIVTAVQWIVSGTLRLLGLTKVGAIDPYALQDEVRGAIELGAEEGAVEEEVAKRVTGALDLGELTVGEVMIHRKNMRMLDADLPPREILAQAMASSHKQKSSYYIINHLSCARTMKIDSTASF